MNERTARRILLIGLGLLLFLAPLKFGNPIEAFTNPAGIFEGESFPRDFLHWLLGGWPPPISFAAIFLLAGLALGILNLEFPISNRPWTFWLPLTWLSSQLLALPLSIYRQASLDALALFAAATLTYYVAALVVREERDLRTLLSCLAGALFVVCLVGFQQKFGGLAAIEDWVKIYQPEALQEDYMRKLRDPRGIRIFSTFVYPPALAGFLVMATGASLATVWLWRERFEPAARWALGFMLVVPAALCLAWSRSKGGILALMLAAVTTLAFVPWSWKRRALTAAAIVAAVVVAFVVYYGVRDVHYAARTGGQRVAYWQAAAKIFADHPWVGTGADTFGSIHGQYQTPGAEYTRLAHNNFVQMASDSGVFGFVTYAMMWTVGLACALRRLAAKADWQIAAAMGAGLTAWMWHNTMDFDLYIPGVALPAFLLLGAVEGFSTPRATLSPTRVGGRSRIVCILLTLGCLLAVWPMVQRIRAQEAFAQANRFLEAKRPNFYAANQAMERAIQLSSANAAYWDQLSWIQSRRSQFLAAIESAKRAANLDPHRASYYWHLGIYQYQAEHGLSERAHAALLRAIERAPFNASYHWQLGLIYGKADAALSARALAEFERARRCEPSNLAYQKNPEQF